MGAFSFAGATLVEPGILVDTTLGASQVLQLLPLGTLAFFGASDGGAGGGTVYRFTDVNVAKRFLRAGPLYDALSRAASIGGATGLVAVVLGTKTPATLALTGAVGANQPTATLNSGDQGTWNNDITVEIIAGTAANSVAVLFSYPDPVSGKTVYIGGLGTQFDNITLFSQLAKVIAANSLITPPQSSGLPPLFTLTVTEDGLPSTIAVTNLAGGTGSGSQALDFTDVKAGIDGAITTSFDIGHLVQIYDTPSQAYADAQAVAVSTYGNLRRFIHQVKPTGTAPNQTKVQNSEAAANAGIEAANAIDSIRSSVCPQQIGYSDPNTGVVSFVDTAPFICGLAALLGATGEQGPASPLTYEIIPGALGVDYEILSSTGDMANAILGGVMALEQIGQGSATRVRIKQSVTTAPLDPDGNEWIFAEFSVVRVSDAVLANCKAAVEQNRPKIIGGGNVRAIMNAALADVRDVLEDALDQSWIVAFDPASITIYQTGATGTDDILKYDMGPTLPLNHLGIGQNLLPYSAAVSLGGNVNG